VTEEPSATGLGLAPIDVCDEAWLTTSAGVVVPVEPMNTPSPEYDPVIVSVPTGAAEELHHPPPNDSVAVHSGVVPAVNVTDPVGAGTPVAPVVTVAV
jgi:hypothetical protein